VRTGTLATKPTLDFGMELVVGEGPFREPPTVMQPTVCQWGIHAQPKVRSQLARRGYKTKR